MALLNNIGLVLHNHTSHVRHVITIPMKLSALWCVLYIWALSPFLFMQSLYPLHNLQNFSIYLSLVFFLPVLAD